MKTLALIPSEDDQRKLGRQIKDLHRASTLGMLDCIAVGDLVTEVRKVVSTCGNNSSHGPQTKGDGIKGWLETYTDGEVTLSTAYRYEQLAEGVREELAIGKRVNLADVITGSATDAKSKALLEKISAFVAGKSQRTLLIGIGKPDGERGGKRGKKDKPPTPEELAAAYLQDARDRAVNVFSGLHELDDRWQVLSDDELQLAIENAEKFAKRAKKYLETPKTRRAELNLAKYHQETKS